MQNQLVKYKSLPIWSKETFPKSFQKKHNTKSGTWAKLTILKGKLKYYALDERGDVETSCVFSVKNEHPLIEPQAWHKVEPLSDDLECFIEFYCQKEEYYQKRYQLSNTHSEVVNMLKYIEKGSALDLGCGRGRNSIFLHKKGFSVRALDYSENSINKLKEIISTENECKGIQADLYNINTASLKKDYDLIISTVVFQFLQATSVNAIIKNIQEHTKQDGYNLIVAPVSTNDCPCPLNFSFTFKENELKDYYRYWNICKYDESKGTFHRKDEHGNRYQAKFATLIAQKQN